VHLTSIQALKWEVRCENTSMLWPIACASFQLIETTIYNVASWAVRFCFKQKFFGDSKLYCTLQFWMAVLNTSKLLSLSGESCIIYKLMTLSRFVLLTGFVFLSFVCVTFTYSHSNWMDATLGIGSNLRIAAVLQGFSPVQINYTSIKVLSQDN